MVSEGVDLTRSWPVKLARLTVDYPIAREHERRGGHRLHELVREVREGVSEALRDAVGASEFKRAWQVRASTGRGATWANVCWLAAMRRDETTSAREGRYLALLCDVEGRHFVQAIVWGTASFRERCEARGDGAHVRELLRQRREQVAAWLRERVDTAYFSVDEDVDLGARSELARDYEASCLVWRSYAVDEDLEAVSSDLVRLSEVYEEMLQSK